MKSFIAQCIAIVALMLGAPWLLFVGDAQAQIDIRNDGGYVGRARDILDCRGGLSCSVDAGVGYISAAGIGGGGSGVTPSGLCGDGGSALGWDGGAYYCAQTTQPGACSAGQYMTAVSRTAAPTCAVGTSGSTAIATLTASQTTNLTRGDHVKFVSATVTGSLITCDTATTYTSQDNVASLGRCTLTGGHTYFLAFMMPYVSIVDFMVVAIANADNGTPISTEGIYNISAGGFSIPIQTMYTPGSNTRVEVRITKAGGGISFFGKKCSDDSNLCWPDAGDSNAFPTLSIMSLN